MLDILEGLEFNSALITILNSSLEILGAGGDMYHTLTHRTAVWPPDLVPTNHH